MAATKSRACLVHLCFYVLICIVFVKAQTPHRRFEYKFSFKPPYLSQRDGSVPFWEYSGHAIASEENLRITPSLRSQRGMIWSKSSTNFDWWEVEIIFRVTGRGRIGADGLAMWYSAEKGKEGPVFGSSDKWNGLGVFFDSFDNDNKHNNPYVMAMVNDGTIAYDHQKDGSTQQLGGCLRDFRNKPFPAKAKIEYYKNVLTVLFHNGMTNSDRDYELCLRAENVVLPSKGYFGVSAATGGLADDHDVQRFITYSLRPPELALIPDDKITKEEKEALSEEYRKHLEDLEKKKKDYFEEHPEARKDADYDPDDWFESDQQRELRQIFTGQTQMFNTIKELNGKLDEIIGRQERTLSAISSVTQAAAIPPASQQQQHPGAQQPPPPPPQIVETIRRNEVEMVLNNQKEIVLASRDIKAFVAEIHQKSNNILQAQQQQPTAQVKSVGYETHNLINELKRDLNVATQKIGSAQPCPTQPTNCVTTTVFVVLMIIQVVLILGYIIYRNNKEAQAKKFY